MIAGIVNKIWLFHQRGLFRHFNRHTTHCDSIQETILMRCLQRNAATAFGITYQFDKIKSYQDYSQAVPVIENFSEIHPYIDSMLTGKSDVLFTGKPLFFETTSGSSSASKLIPYNHQMKKELKAAVAVWMCSLFQIDPMIFSGKAYWSLSPALKQKSATESGIRIGTDDDAEYFDPVTSYLLKQVLASPPHIRNITEPHAFYVKTWQHLLHCSDISFVSVWSPQFLIRLVDFLKQNREEISNGVNLPKSKVDTIQGAIAENTLNLELIFPNLRMISCWTSAQSAIWLNDLKKVVGNIPIQGKGLLATEGVVTIPADMERNVLAYTSHFYEFKEMSGKICTASQLEKGETYEAIITTGAGLYRYNTHDLVTCNGYLDRVPCLTFRGRSGNVSDMVGEKLSENMLVEIFVKARVSFSGLEALYMVPVKSGHSAGYKVIIEGNAMVDGLAICQFIERHLMDNPYYYQGLKSNQLKGLIYMVVESGFTGKLTSYYQSAKKIKDGDLKLPLLYPIGFLDDLLEPFHT